MGFQIPPTLPDYKKLQIILANSGVQSWNPPIFDILSRIIEAVGQSQSTLVGTTIENIVNNVLSTNPITPSGAPILNITYNIDITAGSTFNTIPVVILPATIGKAHIPIALFNRTQQTRSFAGNVTGTLEYTSIPGTPITAGITLIQGGLFPGPPGVIFFANGIGVSASFASTLSPINTSIEMKGSTDSANGGFAGAPDINFISGTLFYIEA